MNYPTDCEQQQIVVIEVSSMDQALKTQAPIFHFQSKDRFLCPNISQILPTDTWKMQLISANMSVIGLEHSFHE